MRAGCASWAPTVLACTTPRPGSSQRSPRPSTSIARSPARSPLWSQSGAYGSHLGLLARRRRIDVGLWVTTGNECDVTVSECIAWMAARADVEVVAAYAEGTQDGDALLASLDAARAGGKSVFFTKTGTSEVGAEAAKSHTAALAGADAVFDSVLAQHGVVRTDTTEEMLDAAYAASFGALPSNRRVGFDDHIRRGRRDDGRRSRCTGARGRANAGGGADSPEKRSSRSAHRAIPSTSPHKCSTRPASSATSSIRCSTRATTRPSSRSSPTSRRSTSWRNPS